jgi:hypothetical protein
MRNTFGLRNWIMTIFCGFLSDAGASFLVNLP